MTDRITEIQARCEAATPGPWKLLTRGNTVKSLAIEGVCGGMKFIDSADASFIAHSREDIPYLLAQLAALKQESEGLAINGGKYMKIAEKRYEMYEAAIKRAEEAEISLAEAQRRERAAVHDLRMVMKGADSPVSCHVCAGGDCTNAPDCEPKWRGPQEAGKGEAK